MSGQTAVAGGDLRTRILANPEIVLGDPAVMRVLMERSEARPGRGGKVVDLRSVAMARLEDRLDRLEEAHRTVIAAAYENLAGTQQIHRAILQLLEAQDLEAFVDGLVCEVALILRVDAVRLVVECDDPAPPAPDGSALAAVLDPVAPGAIAALHGGGPGPRVTLRRGARVLTVDGEPELAGEGVVEAEAWLSLDLGRGGTPALLALGSCDPDQFAPGQGTELLDFLAGVLERALRRWIE